MASECIGRRVPKAIPLAREQAGRMAIHARFARCGRINRGTKARESTVDQILTWVYQLETNRRWT